MRERTVLAEPTADDTLALLAQMEGVYQCTTAPAKHRWAARAMTTKNMGFGETPRKAMRLALELDKLEEESQAIRRERKAIDPPPGRVLDGHKSRRQRSLLDDE